ncbi:efflux RND transporter periplasmic adaptor subunit [Paenibacillus sp.]|uniref:efflux RND transporter periplasmic adaptor subunit n=1 Tax=Paenibacillus sp. TaxID=58172 RepID=UPI002D6B71D5|nr:efflux RND transporter periplasmic adaptor subunit [Paenibacillus sp.]HZG88218.1 efflux RND transporter periplasmic adaptor subunit [Paenibacillus sp.]
MFTKWWTDDSKRPNRSLRVAVAACLTVALAVTSGCSLLPKEDEEEVLPVITPPKLSEKPTYEVKTGTIEQKVQAIGKLMSLKEETLFFEGNGSASADTFRVKDVYVETGQAVEAGALIAELDVADKQRELRRKKLEFRKEELNMIEILRKSDEYEPEELEALKVDFEMKRTELVELEESIAGAQLTAPFAGTIVSVAVKPGDSVKAYDKVAVLADLTQLVVAAKFDKDDVEDIAVGMDAVVNINSAGEFKGKVDRLPTETSDNNNGGGNPNQPAEESIEQFLLVELETWPEGVTRGTPLSVSVITNRKDNAIVIPPAALRSYNGRSYVQVVDAEGNKAEIDVEVGMQTSTQVEIVKGLEPGQKVVGR